MLRYFSQVLALLATASLLTTACGHPGAPEAASRLGLDGKTPALVDAREGAAESTCPNIADWYAQTFVPPSIPMQRVQDGSPVPELVFAQRSTAGEVLEWMQRPIPGDPEAGLPASTREPNAFLVAAPTDEPAWVCNYEWPDGFQLPAFEDEVWTHLTVIALADDDVALVGAHQEMPDERWLGPSGASGS